MSIKTAKLRIYGSLAIALGLVSLITFPVAAYSQNSQPSQSFIVANNQSTPQISYARLGIGGINLSMTEAQVRQKLGRPRRVENWNSPAVGKGRTLTYPNLIVRLVEDGRPGKQGNFSVYDVSTTSRQSATVDGVRVGDSRGKVINTYGQPTEERKEGNAVYLVYNISFNDFPTAFIFKLQNGRVTEMRCLDILT
jgi:hypothetical protein